MLKRFATARTSIPHSRAIRCWTSNSRSRYNNNNNTNNNLLLLQEGKCCNFSQPQGNTSFEQDQQQQLYYKQQYLSTKANNEDEDGEEEKPRRKMPKGSFTPFLLLMAMTGIGIYYANRKRPSDADSLYSEEMLQEPPTTAPLVLPKGQHGELEPMFTQIIEALNAGQYDAVLTLADTILQKQDTATTEDHVKMYAMYFQAKAFYAMGAPHEAQRKLDSVIRIYNANQGKTQFAGFKGAYADALHTLTLSLFMLQKFKDAMGINSLLMKEQPWNLEYLSERADLHLHMSDFTSAVQWCDKLLSLATEHPQVFERNLKASYAADSIDLNTFVSEVYRIKGYSQFKQQKLEEALSCFNKAIALNPKKNNYYSSKGEILSRLGRFDEAYAALSAAPNADTNRHFVFHRLEALANMRRFDEALELHQKALGSIDLEKEPINVRIDVTVTKAKLQMGAKKYDELLKTTMDLEPLFPTEALRLRAFALGGLDRFPEALATIDKAIAVAPNDPKLKMLRESILKKLA